MADARSLRCLDPLGVERIVRTTSAAAIGDLPEQHVSSIVTAVPVLGCGSSGQQSANQG